MVETLSGTISAISGGNVYNVMLHVNAATLRGLTSFILCLIYCSFRKFKCTKFPLGGGGSIASSRPTSSVPLPSFFQIMLLGSKMTLHPGSHVVHMLI